MHVSRNRCGCCISVCSCQVSTEESGSLSVWLILFVCGKTVRQWGDSGVIRTILSSNHFFFCTLLFPLLPTTLLLTVLHLKIRFVAQLLAQSPLNQAEGGTTLWYNVVLHQHHSTISECSLVCAMILLLAHILMQAH